MLGHGLGYENPYVQHRDMIHGDDAPWVLAGMGGGPGRFGERRIIRKFGVWRGFLRTDVHRPAHTGAFTAQHESGNRMVAGKMLRGREDGDWQYWYEDGTLAAEGTFVRGREQGVWRLWHQSGELATSIPFQDGQPVEGHQTDVFDETGTLRGREVPLPHGGSRATWFYPNGSRMSEGARSPSGLEEGIWTSWHENGHKRVENEYVDGEIHGYRRTWYTNGQLESDASWESDEPHGDSREWYENGSIKRQGTYHHGGTVGHWQWWSVDGATTLDEDLGDGIILNADPDPASGVRGRLALVLKQLLRRSTNPTYRLNLVRIWDDWAKVASSMNDLESAAKSPIKWQLQEGFMARDALEQAAEQAPQLRQFVESLDDGFRDTTSETVTPLEGGGHHWWWFRRPLESGNADEDNTGWGTVTRGPNGRLRRWQDG